jgi:hypothetical protein
MDRPTRQDQSPRTGAGSEDERLARSLGIGVRIGLVLLAATFVVYVFGLLPPHVPLDRVPSYWHLRAADYLERTGMPARWQWAARLSEGDVLTMVPAVFLVALAAPCLVAVLPMLVRRREFVYVAIIVLQLALFAVAALA